MKSFYVQVKKSEYPTLWYSQCIGDIFEVRFSKVWRDFFECVSRPEFLIGKEDCSIVRLNRFPEKEIL